MEAQVEGADWIVLPQRKNRVFEHLTEGIFCVRTGRRIANPAKLGAQSGLNLAQAPYPAVGAFDREAGARLFPGRADAQAALVILEKAPKTL